MIRYFLNRDEPLPSDVAVVISYQVCRLPSLSHLYTKTEVYKWYFKDGATLECQECGAIWGSDDTKPVHMDKCPECGWSNSDQTTFEANLEKGKS
jgi:hypothetical protein